MYVQALKVGLRLLAALERQLDADRRALANQVFLDAGRGGAEHDQHVVTRALLGAIHHVIQRSVRDLVAEHGGELRRAYRRL